MKLVYLLLFKKNLLQSYVVPTLCDLTFYIFKTSQLNFSDMKHYLKAL